MIFWCFSCEKDNLEQTLRKIMNKDYSKNDGKNQALFISLKLLHGDLKQVYVFFLIFTLPLNSFRNGIVTDKKDNNFLKSFLFLYTFY